MIFRSLVSLLLLVSVVCFALPVWSQSDKYQQEISADVVVELEKGRQLRRAGKFEDATKKLSAITDSQPDYFLAQYNLALAHAQSEDYEQAVMAFEEALRIREEQGIAEATVYNSAAWTYMLAGDYNRSEQLFKIALKGENQELLSKESKRRLLNNVGLLYMYMGDLGQSREHLQKADSVYGGTLVQKNLDLLMSLETAQRAKRPTMPPNWFTVVASYRSFEDARSFALKLDSAEYDFQPHIYLAENDYYGVTLGGYLDYREAVRRMRFAKSHGIAADAYVWQSVLWGDNLLE